MTVDQQARGSSDLESIVRPFLDLIHQLTGLESSYLTEKIENGLTQNLVMSDNRGQLDVKEGGRLPWSDTICEMAIQDNNPIQRNLTRTFSENRVVQDMGIDTYIGVPVLSAEREVMGTLCAASQKDIDVDPRSRVIMELFASLIADRWESERQSQQLTERVELAEQRIRERATFLAMAEHKLKSPVTVIRGWAEELDESWDRLAEDVRRKGVSVIAKSSVQLANQITDLLEEAKGQVIATDLASSRVDLGPVVSNAVSDMEGSSTSHSIIAEIATTSWVHADANALWHVLMHLIENAIKYSPDGGQIVVRTRTDESRVCVDVVDNGPGIPDDVAIFEPFIRGEDESAQGSGLGLHVVKTLMRSMGGDVRASRNESRGSTFTLYLRPVQ